MEFKQTNFEGLIEIYPRIFPDERGFFLETYNQTLFSANGIPYEFVQDNHSFSTKGVLRGLHLQKEPHAQGKLVRAIAGKVLDVVVDIRPSSKTFGQHYKVVLDSELQNMLYVPTGFAHGFLALEDAIFAYKCTNSYNKSAESGIHWADKTLNIDWGFENPNVSEKDQILPTFQEFIALL